MLDPLPDHVKHTTLHFSFSEVIRTVAGDLVEQVQKASHIASALKN